jgi:hypothetical protein
MNKEPRDPLGRFLPGNRMREGSKGGGAPAAAKREFRAMIQEELAKLGCRHLHGWALENPTEFYKIAARLIPQAREVSGPGGKPIEHREVREFSSEELYGIIEDGLTVGDGDAVDEDGEGQ